MTSRDKAGGLAHDVREGLRGRPPEDRRERLRRLMEQVRAGAYRVDCRTLAQRLLERGCLDRGRD